MFLTKGRIAVNSDARSALGGFGEDLVVGSVHRSLGGSSGIGCGSAPPILYRQESFSIYFLF